MTERTAAIAILQQARDLLIQRLTERVLEREQEILADAAGDSFLSEIETIYEQMGSRLAHLNTLLSNLPAADPRDTEMPSVDPIFVDTGMPYGPGFETETAVAAAPLALPAPEAVTDRLQLASTPVSLHLFAAQIEAGDLHGASRSLSELFGVAPTRGLSLTETLALRLALEPNLLMRLTDLRWELRSDSAERALVVLWDCFALHGAESLEVLQSLRARLLTDDLDHG